MKITNKFLHDNRACKSSYKWVYENNLIDLEHEEFINKLLFNNRYDDANWILVKLFNKKQAIRYAINIAELVLDVFEDKFPIDKRPREVIETIKGYLNNSNDINLIDIKNISYNFYSLALKINKLAYASYLANIYNIKDDEDDNKFYYEKSSAAYSIAMAINTINLIDENNNYNNRFNVIDIFDSAYKAAYYAFSAFNDNYIKIKIINKGLELLKK